MTDPDKLRHCDRILINGHLPNEGARDQWINDNLPERLHPHEGSIFAPRNEQDASQGAWRHPSRAKARHGWSWLRIAVMATPGVVFLLWWLT